MLDNVQIIRDDDREKFAVIPYDEYLMLIELLSDEDSLADYLDYLHLQRVKASDSPIHTMDEVRRILALPH